MTKTNYISFTDGRLTNLPAPSGKTRSVYHDSKTPGLTIVVTPKLILSFYFQRRIGGKPEKLFIGRFPELTVSQARKVAAAHNAAISNGENPAQVKRAGKLETTFGQLFDLYLNEHARRHTKTAEDALANYKRYLSDWENRKTSTIYRADVRKLHADLGKNNGKYLANRVIQLIRAVINWGLQNKLIDRKLLEDAENPSQNIKLFKEHKRDRFLQAEEAPLIFHSLTEETNDIVRDYVFASLLTGARKKNVLAMRWSEISFEHATWRIPDTKSGEPQIIPISEPLLNLLRIRYEKRINDWVFPGTGKLGHWTSPKKAWKRVLDRAEALDLIRQIGMAQKWTDEKTKAEVAKLHEGLDKCLHALRKEAESMSPPLTRIGIPDLRLHDLRRSLGSWMAVTGASLPIIGKSLGHKSTEATQIYARLSMAPVREAMSRAATALLDIGFPKG